MNSENIILVLISGSIVVILLLLAFFYPDKALWIIGDVFKSILKKGQSDSNKKRRNYGYREDKNL